MEEDYRNIIRAVVSDYDGGTTIHAAYLFGSHARGTANKESDFDIAVLFKEVASGTLESLHFSLKAEFERALRKPVDVVILNSADLDLVHRVLRDGELLVETDRSARIAFEVLARKRYFDMLPIMRRYRQGPQMVTSDD